MALTLVTGPANSAKAQVVLEHFRAALGHSPLLIVPRAADVEYYRRELAQTGAVLGVAVEAFGGLEREIARRAGLGARVISAGRASTSSAPSARGSISRSSRRRRERLVSYARSPRSSRSSRRAASRLHASPRRSAPGPPGVDTRRSSRASTAPTAGASSASACWTPSSQRRRARRARPLARALGAHARFVYGFDDLEPLQLDAIETLAVRVGVPVALSLPGEPGRVALAGRAGDARNAASARGAGHRLRAAGPPLRGRRRSTTSSARCSRTAARRARRATPWRCSRAATSAPRPSSSRPRSPS